MKITVFSVLLTAAAFAGCSEQNAGAQNKDDRIVKISGTQPTALPKSSTTGERHTGDVTNQYVFLNKVYQKNGQWWADADYIEFLTGEEGLSAAKKRGLAEKEADENGNEHYYLPNDYIIINDDVLIKNLEISPDANIFSYDFKTSGNINAEVTPKTNIRELAKTREDHYPYLIDVKNRKISRIKQIFIP